MPHIVSIPLLLIAALCVLALAHHADADTPSANVWAYVGTYTGPKSQGIYLMKLDPATGALGAPKLAGEMPNPSWVTISPNRKFLYACGEYGMKIGSGIAAFSIGSDGMLTPLNEQPMPGGPCYATVDATGKNLLAASYGDGHVAVFQIAEDGKLSPPTSTDQHPAVGKAEPHAHCIDPDPANRFVLSCDAGIDVIFVYHFDPARGLLTANDAPFAPLPAHAAPRHLVFSKDGKFVYTIQEAASTVTVFTYDAEHGVLHEIQSISTLPADVTDHKGLSTAELILHPSGKFLYGSNRGHDSLVGYRIDQQTGKLSLIGHTRTQGKIPRGFGIDPSGQWLVVGNQKSDNIVEFHVDLKTGELKPTGTMFELGAPVCVKFMEGKAF